MKLTTENSATLTHAENCGSWAITFYTIIEDPMTKQLLTKKAMWCEECQQGAYVPATREAYIIEKRHEVPAT